MLNIVYILFVYIMFKGLKEGANLEYLILCWVITLDKCKALTSGEVMLVALILTSKSEIMFW